MSEENNFNEIWGRVKLSTEIKTQKQLAVALCLTPQAITEMKKKEKFPEKWAYKLSEQFEIDARWLLDGVKRNDGKHRKGAREEKKFEILNEIEEWLEEEVRMNPKKKDWFEVEFEKKFEDFKKWKLRKETGPGSSNHYPSSKVA